MTADSAENPLFMALTWRLFRCPHDYRQFSVRESVLSSVTENSAQRTSDFSLWLNIGPGSTQGSSYRQ